VIAGEESTYRILAFVAMKMEALHGFVWVIFHDFPV
jgi:hypothetical protein